ncbi:hypothetical protein AKUH3B208X_00820 [Apilactobacillus kunkeei]|nr:hypothetical protein AKUH3B208X_00820 [Apilactobacillus kunkeei]
MTEKKDLVERVRKALYFGKIMSYAQGFEQLRFASEQYDWNLKFGELAQIWREGCIIRAQFLQNITDAFEKDENLTNLIVRSYFSEIATSTNKMLVMLFALATKAGIPVHHFQQLLTTMIHTVLKYYLLTYYKHNVTTSVLTLMNVLTVKVTSISPWYTEQ